MRACVHMYLRMCVCMCACVHACVRVCASELLSNNIVMAYVVMDYIVMAYIVMAACVLRACTCVRAHACARGGTYTGPRGRGQAKAAHNFFFRRSLPGASFDGERRRRASLRKGGQGRASPRRFRCHPPDPIWPLGVRRRRAPKKLPKIGTSARGARAGRCGRGHARAGHS